MRGLSEHMGKKGLSTTQGAFVKSSRLHPCTHTCLKGLDPQMSHVNGQGKHIPAGHMPSNILLCCTCFMFLVAIAVSTSACTVQHISLGPSSGSSCLMFAYPG